MFCMPKGLAPLSFQACVRNFSETPLQLLEKIKNVFNETKNLLEKDKNIFSKNCSNSFAKCPSQGKHGRGQLWRGCVQGEMWGGGIPEAAWLRNVFLCFLCICVASCTSGSCAHVFADMCVHVL